MTKFEDEVKKKKIIDNKSKKNTEKRKFNVDLKNSILNARNILDNCEPPPPLSLSLMKFGDRSSKIKEKDTPDRKTINEESKNQPLNINPSDNKATVSNFDEIQILHAEKEIKTEDCIISESLEVEQKIFSDVQENVNRDIIYSSIPPSLTFFQVAEQKSDIDPKLGYVNLSSNDSNNHHIVPLTHNLSSIEEKDIKSSLEYIQSDVIENPVFNNIDIKPSNIILNISTIDEQYSSEFSSSESFEIEDHRLEIKQDLIIPKIQIIKDINMTPLLILPIQNNSESSKSLKNEELNPDSEYIEENKSDSSFPNPSFILQEMEEINPNHLKANDYLEGYNTYEALLNVGLIPSNEINKCKNCKTSEKIEMIKLPCNCSICFSCLQESVIMHKCVNCDRKYIPKEIEYLSIYFN